MLLVSDFLSTSSIFNLFVESPVESKIFSITNPFGIEMLTRLRLAFSHLREHNY